MKTKIVEKSAVERMVWHFLVHNNYFGIVPKGDALYGITAKQVLHGLKPLRFVLNRLNPSPNSKDIRRVCEAFQNARKEFKQAFGIDVLKWKGDMGELHVKIQVHCLEQETREVLSLQRAGDRRAKDARKVLGKRYAIAAQFLSLSSWGAMVASVEHELELEQA